MGPGFIVKKDRRIIGAVMATAAHRRAGSGDTDAAVSGPSGNVQGGSIMAGKNASSIFAWDSL